MTADLARIAAAAQSLLAAGRADEAAASLRAVAPQFAERADVLALFGTALRRAGDTEAAAATFAQACAAAPADPNLAVGLGLCHRARGDNPAALAAYRRATELDPNHAIAHCNLGNVLLDLAHYDEAISHHRRAIELDPRLIEAWIDLAKSLDASARLRDADANYLAALRRFTPTTVAGKPLRLFELGAVFLQLGWLDKAFEFTTRAAELLPGTAEIEFSLAVIHLSRGDHERGWPLFESRLRCADQRIVEEFAELTSPRLTLLPAHATQRVLVLPEQGYGDRIQFSRYLPLLAQRCARACYVVDDELLGLMQASGIDAVSQRAALPAHDAHCFVMSLPHLFGTTRESLPAPRRYLSPPATAVARWRERLPADSRLRVGLNWAGNPAHRQDRYRSMDLTELAPLMDLANVHFYAVQKYTGDIAAQRGRLAAFGITDAGSELGDFADAAGLLANLDLVVSVDTATAHLAGALGRPVWLLLPSVTDYRWTADGDASPWYPSMRLFRQQTPLLWQPVIARVRAALVAQVAQGR